uniref:PSMD12/CSN4-like N-terminal domain-containing protein n=1 Tax=Ananas comosus var. bracteatus TaxID=296719 RepID=A0A6V7Q3T3_ANACO|nr:unnamed protein product [Ananas comosus var. bracteatus]
MESALASASSIADQRQKIEQYRLILASVLSSSPTDIAQAKRFIDHMVSDEVPLVVSRQLLQSFAQELGRLDADAQKEIAHYALAQIQPRVVSFEEQVLLLNLVIFPFLICLTNCLEYRDWSIAKTQVLKGHKPIEEPRVDNRMARMEWHIPNCVHFNWLVLQVSVIREKLAELYESEQQWSKAAQMLSGIDLESGIRMLDDAYKLSKCVHIARLYLEDDDAVNAEVFINKASFLVSTSQHEVLNLQYKVVCYARILDLKRKFLEAALRYYDISQIEKRKLEMSKEIDEDALEQALSSAVTCTILAAAGPQRSRVLATLYKVFLLVIAHC